MSRRDDTEQFYSLLAALQQATGGRRLMADCHGKMQWPKRGVYFFFEPGECRAGDASALRVVRVGTHGVSADSKSTLWSRLSAHRGSVRTGGGNQRGSIFRRLVGMALIRKNGLCGLESWPVGSNASKSVKEAEHALEKLVSEHIGRMQILCLPIDDEPSPQSQRAYIERNSIALLSNCANNAADPPSHEWLGRDCDSELVRQSGLWNNRHVKEDHDQEFLRGLANLVEGHKFR